jgi:hypothetical protein
MKRFNDLKPGDKFIFLNDADPEVSNFYYIPVYEKKEGGFHQILPDGGIGLEYVDGVFARENQKVWRLAL